MFGERYLIKAGYRWDVFADFQCNASGVRVATRKTPRGAEQFAVRFGKRYKVEVWTKLRHDPSLTKKKRR